MLKLIFKAQIQSRIMLSVNSRETLDMEQMRKSIRKSQTATRIFTIIGPQQLACLMVFVSQVIWVIAFIYPNQHNFSAFETMMVRGGTVAIINMLICYGAGYTLDFNPSLVSMKSLNIRNFTMCLHGVMTAFVQFYLPLPIVHIIGCTGSIFVCIADYIQFGVKLNGQQLKGVILGFIGIILVINHNFILSLFGYQTSEYSEFQNYHSHSVYLTTLMAMIYLAVMVIWGYAVVETKRIRNTNAFQVNFHLGICLLFSSAFFFPFLTHQATFSQILMAVLLEGIPLTIGQLLFIGAFIMSDEHGRLSVMIFSLIVTAYFVSIFRYHQPISMIALLGTVLACYGVAKCVLNKA